MKEAQAQLESMQKEARNHDKAMRAKATQVEDLKKQAQKLETKRDNLEREAKELADQSKGLEKRVSTGEHSTLTESDAYFLGRADRASARVDPHGEGVLR